MIDEINSLNPKPVYSQSKTSQTRKEFFEKSIIKEIALTSLKELVITLAFVGAAYYFATREVIPYLFGSAIGLTLVNGFFRYLDKSIKQLPLNNKENPKRLLTLSYYVTKAIPHYPSLIFSAFDILTRNMLIHETGHAFAAKAIYIQADPKITIEFGEGVTRYGTGKMTAFGESLGENYAKAFISASGTAAAMVDASVNLIGAYSIRKKHPELSRYLRCMAIASIANHIFYALSALWDTTTSGHDFISLKRHLGLHPCLSALAIPMLPLLCQSICLAVSRLLKPAAAPTA